MQYYNIKTENYTDCSFREFYNLLVIHSFCIFTVENIFNISFVCSRWSSRIYFSKSDTALFHCNHICILQRILVHHLHITRYLYTNLFSFFSSSQKDSSVFIPYTLLLNVLNRFSDFIFILIHQQVLYISRVTLKSCFQSIFTVLFEFLCISGCSV